MAIDRKATLPERRCLVTGETGDKSALVRFALAPDGQVVPDIAERLPGRGAWVVARRDAVVTAAAKRLFARGFKCRALADPALADQVEKLLAERCLELLGLAKRAGQAAAGFDKAHALLASGDVAFVLQAADGAPDGLRRLKRAAPDVAVLTCFDAVELGAALGRDMAVHVALKPGGLATALRRDVERLRGFRDNVAVTNTMNKSGGKDG